MASGRAGGVAAGVVIAAGVEVGLAGLQHVPDGDEQRPDLSNVQMALEALSASGLEKGNAAYQRALIFLSRCQNRSESNSMKVDTDAGVIGRAYLFGYHAFTLAPLSIVLRASSGLPESRKARAKIG
jgi:hypothetical protein